MSKTRVLVVDDSALVRKLVGDVLASEPDLELAGTAPNGRIALAKIRQSAPDLVTLDVEMPEMGGLATLRELRRSYPALPVIMLSSVTERGASATLDSLLLGARDYVAKPSGAAFRSRVRRGRSCRLHSRYIWKRRDTCSSHPA